MKYRDHTEILPLLEEAGQSWAHVSDDDTRRELRVTLSHAFAENNGAAALLHWLTTNHADGLPLEGLLLAAARDIDEDGQRLTALAELLARSEKEGGHAIQ